ncbi:hypothetical protein [Ensifer adhaerens]|uniref:hypothetical protein n=1 Tax=Ensifer adhaerens TaxID=106592 RepID=UPI0009902834|nr:hypothetical protein [Ensifer adhaerens]
MKPQQRKFIVEVKSARRRSATRPASIWGDTDLKALARAAESEAPHLFATVGQAADLAPPQSTEGSDQDGGTVGGAPPIAGSSALPEEAVVLPARSEDALAAHVNADLPVKVSQTPKPPRPTRVARRPQNKTMATAAPVAVDALAALEDENRGLKALLAQRLRQENALLRQMLERFGAN